MSRSDWVLGDDKGSKYVEVPSLFPKNVVKHLDYVVYGDVKFVNEKKLHDDRIRRLEVNDGR